MGKLKRKIGLIILLAVLLTTTVGIATAVDVEYGLIAPPAGAPWTSADEIVIKFINVDKQRTGVGADVIQINDPTAGLGKFAGVEIEYGKTFTLKVETQYSEKMVLRFIDAETGTTVWSKEFTGSFSEEIDTVAASLKPGWYFIQIGPVPARSGVAGETLVTAHDTNGNKVVDAQGDPTYGNVFVDASNHPFNVLYVLPAHNVALIEINLKNPSDEIAKGDLVVFEVKIYGRSNFNWRLEGPYNMTGNLLSQNGVGVVDHKATVSISTVDIIENRGGTTGAYKFKVIDPLNPDNTKTYTFKIVEPIVTISADKSEVAISSTIKITGTTNIAETGGSYDEDDAAPASLVNPAPGKVAGFTDDNLVFLFLIEGTYVSKSELKIIPFNSAWGGIDNDGDGIINEEDANSTDDDGDRLIDEDLADPAAVGALPAGVYYSVWIAPKGVDKPAAEDLANNIDFLGILDSNGNWVILDDDDNDGVADIIDNDKSYMIRSVAIEYIIDGAYSEKFDLSRLGLTRDDIGDWQVIVFAFTRLNPTVMPQHSVMDYSANNVVYFKATEPKITINPIGVVARGEKFKIVGHADVKSGCYVWIFIEDGKDNFNRNVFYQRTGNPARGEPTDEDPADPILDVTIGAEKGNYIMVVVDINGNFESPEIDVNPNARLGTYTIKAIVTDTNRGINVPDPDQRDWVASTSYEFKVVKQKLNVSVMPSTAVVGGKITIFGNATTDYVYVYASEPNIFEDVEELPTLTIIPNPTTLRIPVVDGKFKRDIKVRPAVDEGSYTLYVFAPSDPRRIDVANDRQAAVSIVVKKIGIVDYPSEIIVVRGEPKEIKLKVNAEDDDHVAAYIKFEGQGIKYRYSGGQEIHPVNGTYTITIDPYYSTGRGLTPDPYRFDATTGRIVVNKALPEGLYTLGIKLYECEQVAGQWRPKTEVQRLLLPVIVKNVDYTVDMPSEITVGQKLVITIKSNPPRSDEYDKVYVILSYALKEYIQTATFENGTAKVEFETYGLPTGTAKVYVRDTMGTVADANPANDPNNIYDPYDIRTYYDILPTDSYAKNFGADDDILWIGQINIVEAVTPTPTTPVTTPTTPVTTPTTPAVTTPTTPITTPTTSVTTPVTTPTTPTAPGVPGFEAIFAIVGLLAVAYLLRRR